MNLVSLDRTNRQQMLELQGVFDKAPGYLRSFNEQKSRNDDAFVTLHTLPNAKNYSDKVVFGVYEHREMIGCVDLIRGYPTPNVAFLGLLLLAEPHQGRGLGRKIYEDTEQVIKGWAEIDTARLAVLENNSVAVPFWRKMGFSETGERSTSYHKEQAFPCLVMQKSIKTVS